MRTILSTALILGCALAGCAGAQKNEPPPAAKTEEKPSGEGNTMPAKQDRAKLETDVRAFIDRLVARVAPLEKEMNLANWEATNFGKQEDYDRASEAEIALRKIYSALKDFEFLKKAQESGLVQDPLLERQVSLLKDAYQENQLDPALLTKMVRLGNEVQKAFNDYRGRVGGKEVADNDLYDLLRNEKNSVRRQEAWEAYQNKGAVVREKLLALVKLRNEAARKLGYANFYEMRLRLMEQDPKEIQALFDDLALQTDAAFRELMNEVNAELAKRYHLKPEALRPWHYEDPFFQEAPTLRGVDLDPYFQDKDPRKVVSDFYQSIGLDPSDILQRSDLYERAGKEPHAYCTDIDRNGDVRILANLRNSEKWTSTLLHEMGHGVYDKNFDFTLPFFLRADAHIFTTEAIAEMFGRLTRNPAWLEQAIGVPRAKLDAMAGDIHFGLRLSMLIFARWTMVMVNFERELYGNPDQDLNKVWWELKAHFQLQHPPEGRNAPDWAAKIHFTTAPVYYHNYMLGQMMASQLLHHMAKNILKTGDAKDIAFVGHPELGEYLEKFIFQPGATLRWDQLLIRATGETLTPKYFVEQFVKE